MGYGVYFRDGRWAGYDVPAVCDEPDCNAAIDRGLACACGGGPAGDVPNCGLFFCGDPDRVALMRALSTSPTERPGSSS